MNYNLNELIDNINEAYQEIQISVLDGGGHLILNESAHLTPNIHDYFDRFKTACLREILNGNNHFVLDENIFQGMDTFFNKAHIEINYKEIPNGCNQNSVTSAKPITIVNNKANEIILRGYIESDVTHLPYILASFFYHELHHAYENYQRTLKTNGKNNLFKYVIASNYHNLNKIKNSCPPYGEDLYYVLYHLSEVEKSAYISGAVGEAKELMKFNSSNIRTDIKSFIERLSSYKKYKMLLSHYYELENVYQSSIQEELLDLFNTNAGLVQPLTDDDFNHFLKNQKYKIDSKTYRFNTYEALMWFLYNRVQKAYNDFVSKVSRCICDLLSENKFNLI